MTSRLFFSLFIVLYALGRLTSNGQDDATLIINNQVDQNVINTLNTSSAYTDAISEQVAPGGITLFAHDPNQHISGISPIVKPVTVSLLNFDSFSSKDSFIGMGVATSYQTQVGADFLFSTGTDLQSYLNYQHLSKDLLGTTNYRSDAYGGSINLVQRIIPIEAITENQPRAVQDFSGDGNSTETPTTLANGKKYLKDFYPNYDLNIGLLASLTAPDIATLKKNKWKNSNQNAYALTPQVVYDLYLRPQLKDPTSTAESDWIPNSVSLIAAYTDTMTMVDNGTSSSAGNLSLQDRNTYIFPIGDPVVPTDPITGLPTEVGKVPAATIQVTQTMAIIHDTNEEMVPGSTTPIAYQNWGRFGVALTYTNPKFNAKLEYYYDAFNAQYDNHTVSLTMSYKF
jgi:hypothetical protein